MAVYRGVMLYGESGAGKSSLVNAGLLPEATRLGFTPGRVRVQPRTGEELVIERIATADGDAGFLPLLFAPDDEGSSRIVLSTQAFEERLRAAGPPHRPLIVFDQFEELLTLFEEAGASEMQQRIVELVVTLLRGPLPVKLVFAFREDYLGKVKQLLGECPELVDQALRLTPPAPDTLATIIRGPFERHPGRFAREIAPELADRLRTELAERFGTGDLSLSEVQTVCLRLWQAADPETLLAARGVQGLLEDYLGEALEAFPPALRGAAISLLGQMVTSAGTRNVLTAEDLIRRVREEEDIPAALIEEALERLESESRLVRRERRRELYLYEVTSEFLLPWIRRRRDEFRRNQDRRRYRRQLRIFGSIGGALLTVAAVVVLLALWALHQRDLARGEAAAATSLALSSAAATQLNGRPDVSLLLALAANRVNSRVEARSSMVAALAATRGSGVSGILHGHTAAVTSLAFSPDGRTLVTGSVDKTIRHWDARTHRKLGRPLSQTSPIFSVAFSPDGHTLASGDGNRTIRLWDVRTHKQLSSLIATKFVLSDIISVAFSPDGRTLASGGDRIRLWDVGARKPRGRPIGPRFGGFASGSAVFSRDGRMLASASADGGVVRLLDVRTHKQLSSLFTARRSYISSLALSPDGRTLATASADETVRLWDVRTHRKLGRLLTGHRKDILSLAFSPDGRTLASASDDKTVRVWDVRTQKQLGRPLTGHTEAVNNVKFSPDGRTLASASDDHTVRLWDLRAARPLDFPIPRSVAFSPNGRTLASAGNDGTLQLWDVRTRTHLGRPLTAHRIVTSLAFSPDGRTLASASLGKTIKLWSVRTHKQLGRPLRQDSPIYSVAFRPDGHTLASGDAYSRVWLWDVRTHKQLVEPLTRVTGAGYDVAFSPDGHILASGRPGGTIRLWDVRTRKELPPPLVSATGVTAVAFGPDGHTLAVAGTDRAIRLWDVAARKQLSPPLTGHRGDICCVAFSSDGHTLASADGHTLASADGPTLDFGGQHKTVRLWDLASHTQLGRPLTGHTAYIRSIAFSPDGRTLASGSQDGTIRLWEGILWGDFAELQKEVCSIVGTGLSKTEWTQYGAGIPYRQTCS